MQDSWRRDDTFFADCPARSAIELIGSTWTIVVIHALRDRPRRPVELRACIGGISSKMLTQTLRRLERNGIVARHAYTEAPPRVEYELTEFGRRLLEPIDTLARWAEQHIDTIVSVPTPSRPQVA